jgi:hypothetical protein
MARLQILELPEGSGDERPPFVLVVDELPADEAGAAAIRRDLGDGDVTALIGARAVLAFECTIEIPANHTTAYLPTSEERAEPAHADERVIQAEEKLKAFMDRRHGVENERKTALLDALDMDRTRDWDDIRNAAAGLRKDRDAKAEALERLYAGEEPFVENLAVTPTPGQFIWKWNRATPEKRLSMAAEILAGMKQANDCFIADHETQIAGLRAEAARPRTETPNA